MGIKDELRHGLKNVINDVDLSVTKTWKVTYKGQQIRFENSMKNERLFINNELVAEIKNNSLFSHLKPSSTLTAELILDDGTTEKVAVKIGGIVNLTIQIKVGRKLLLKEKMKIEVLPWENKTPIITCIESQLKEHGKIVETRLSDSDYLYKIDESTEPGYLDFIGYEEPLPFFEKNLVKHVKLLIDNPTTKRRRIIYEKVNDEFTCMYSAELLYHIEIANLNKTRLQEEALWFLENAAHREVVKFSLLLLGVTNVEPIKERLYNIALHEEFTSYAILGLSQLQHDGHHYLWKLANELNGWGKVAIMHNLEAITPEEKTWYLHQTFTDANMNREVSLIISQVAEFDVLLAEDVLDEATLLQINAVLFYLLSEDENGVRYIDEYDYAAQTLKQFIHHVENMADNRMIQSTIYLVKQYVEEDDEQWEVRYEQVWHEHDRDFLKEKLTQLLKK